MGCDGSVVGDELFDLKKRFRCLGFNQGNGSLISGGYGGRRRWRDHESGRLLAGVCVRMTWIMFLHIVVASPLSECGFMT